MNAGISTQSVPPSFGRLLAFYGAGSVFVGTCGWLLSTQPVPVTVAALTGAAVLADVARRTLSKEVGLGRIVRDSVVLLRTMFSILRWSDEPSLWSMRLARLPIIAAASLGLIAATTQIAPNTIALPIFVGFGAIAALVVSALLGEYERVRMIRALMRRSDALNAVTSWLSENAQALSHAPTDFGSDRGAASVFLHSMKCLTDVSLWRKDVTFHLRLPMYGGQARWPMSTNFDEAHEELVTLLSRECLQNARSAYLPRADSRFLVFGLADDLPKVQVSLWTMPVRRKEFANSFLCVPILENSRPCGVLVVEGKQTDAFSSTDALFLKSIGTILTETLEVARAVRESASTAAEIAESRESMALMRVGQLRSKRDSLRVKDLSIAKSSSGLAATDTLQVFARALRELLRTKPDLPLVSREP